MAGNRRRSIPGSKLTRQSTRAGDLNVHTPRPILMGMIELTRQSSRTRDLNMQDIPLIERKSLMFVKAVNPSRGFKLLLEVFDRCDRAG